MFFREARAVNKVVFSPRERKIVEMVAECKNNAAISKELELSGDTVKNIVTRILKRYQFKKKASSLMRCPREHMF